MATSTGSTFEFCPLGFRLSRVCRCSFELLPFKTAEILPKPLGKTWEKTAGSGGWSSAVSTAMHQWMFVYVGYLYHKQLNHVFMQTAYLIAK